MPGIIESDEWNTPSNLELVNVDFEEELSHSSFVKITKDLNELLFTNFKGNNKKYLSVKFIGSKLFENSIIYAIKEEYLDGNNKIEVHDQSRFNNHSNLTIEQALISTIEPIGIKKAIVSFPDESYELLKNLSGTALLQILKERLSLDIIREGDKLLTGGKVLLCEPIDQGRLTKDTIITLVKDFYSAQNFENEAVSSITQLDISSYLSVSKVQERDFEVYALNQHIDHTIPQPNSSDDEEHLAFIKVNDLSKIGVHSGDFVELVLGNVTKLIKVLTFIEPNHYKDNGIYLSPIFLINNNYPKNVKVKKTEKKLSDLSLAQECELSQISSPIMLNKALNSVTPARLGSYFQSKSRIVSIGDLIPVTIDSILAKSLPENIHGRFTLPIGEPDSVGWFKIQSIDGSSKIDHKQYILDPQHITMRTSGFKAEAPPAITEDLNWLKYIGLQEAFNHLKGSESMFPYAKKLGKLIKTSLSNPSLRTTVLLSSLNRNVGKSFIVNNLASILGAHVITVDGYEILNPTSEFKTIGTLIAKLEKVVEECSSLIVFIKHIEALNFKSGDQQNPIPSPAAAKLVELIRKYTNEGAIIIASTNNPDTLADEVRSNFRFEIDIPVPSEEERKQIFQYLFEISRGYVLRNDVSLSSLALQSAGLTPRDLISIVENAKDLATDRLEEISITEGIDIGNLININPIKIIPQDFERAINDARNKFSDAIGAPRIPNVTWDDIGGLDMVKGEILDTIDMPLKHPELFSNGVKKRSGILFYGPPGTGKTLLAKAIATNFSLNFFSVKGPELLNMYIGESEANVRKVFQKARDAKPCVVFFDELDSVAPKRGNQGDSGGVMDRIVSQLLAELDGMSGGDSGDGVFVVGATNRPDLLDEALLRPGRFDKMLYLGVSDTHEKQEKILEALTRKFKMDPKISLKKVADSCPFNFTGADFYALCSDSMLNAMTRVANDVDKKISKYNQDREEPVSTRWWFDNVASQDDINVLVTEIDFDKARRELTPSVSADELAHYVKVRENFEGGKTANK